MGLGHRPTSTRSPIQSRSKRCGNNPPKGPLASGQAHLLEADSENCLPCIHEVSHDPPDLRDIRKYRNPATDKLLWCTRDERVWKQNAFTRHSPNSTDSVICVNAWAKENQAAGAKADVKDGQAAVKSANLRHGQGRAGKPLRTNSCDPARQGSGTSKREGTKVAASSWRRPRRRSSQLQMILCSAQRSHAVQHRNSALGRAAVAHALPAT